MLVVGGEPRILVSRERQFQGFCQGIAVAFPSQSRTYYGSLVSGMVRGAAERGEQGLEIASGRHSPSGRTGGILIGPSVEFSRYGSRSEIGGRRASDILRAVSEDRVASGPCLGSDYDIGSIANGYLCRTPGVCYCGRSGIRGRRFFRAVHDSREIVQERPSCREGGSGFPEFEGQVCGHLLHDRVIGILRSRGERRYAGGEVPQIRDERCSRQIGSPAQDIPDKPVESRRISGNQSAVRIAGTRLPKACRRRWRYARA